MKKVIKMVLASLLVLIMLAGCTNKAGNTGDSGGNTTGGSGDSQNTGGDTASDLAPVTLKFVFHGEKRSSTDEVWAAIADYTRDTLNADFDIQFVSGEDYMDKMVMMASSGEAWDMNFDADWLTIVRMINQGAYLELEDLLPEYAPTLYSKYQDTGILESATLNGHLYALPWTMTMNFRDMFLWRGDLADEAGIDTSNVKDWESIDALLVALREAYPDRYVHEEVVIPDADGSILKLQYGLGVDLKDPELKVFPLETSETAKTAAKYAEKWQQEGIIRADILTDNLDANMLIDQGRQITAFGNHEKANANRAWAEEGARWDYALVFEDGLFPNRTPLANAMAISVTSENPERTLMFMELLETDEVLYDMVHFGIEGETFEYDGEAVVYPEGMDAANSNYMDWGGRWALWKPQFMRPDATYSEGFWEREAEFAASMPENIASPLDGFVFDSSSVSTEASLRGQIYDDGWKLLSAGLANEPYEAALEKINKESIPVGLEVLMEEYQRQIDEFIASK